MHIRVEKEKILEIVDHVEGIVEKRNTIPILSNILIEASSRGLNVTATDLDIVATDFMSDVEVLQNGKTTVAAAIFGALIRKMPSGSQIDMEVVDGRMTIKGGRIRYQIPVLPSDDFPIGRATEGETIQLSIESVVRAFRLVRDSMSTEESRYYLNGAFLAIEEESLVAVSTDGHRLSIAQISDTKIKQPDAIVPRKAVNEILKILPDFEGEMGVTIDERSIRFEIGNLVFTSKLIDGTFPDYTRVVPAGDKIKIKVNPLLLQQAIERVSIVSSERTSAIRLDIEPTKITIIANNPDTGTAQEEVPAESNQEISVGYNGRYLRELLNGYQACENIMITLENETSPALIRPDNHEVDRSVLMPMRI